MRFHIPLRLVSLANMSHKHWRTLSNTSRKQKEATHYCILNKLVEIGWQEHTVAKLPAPPILITITRVGPRKLDDDNLASACKYVRDQIAAEVGVDDGSDLYTWRYEQRKGAYGVDVEITPR